MGEITLSTFVQAVFKYFEPIARENDLSLIRRTDKLYEIPSAHFVMRICFEIGAHRKSINATLIPTDQMPGDIAGGARGELGVAVIVG